MNLEMDKQITVAVEQVVKNDGVRNILNAIHESTGKMVGQDVLGGRERVNRNGKMTKRIKRNMRRIYDISLEDKLIQDIGNIMNAYSLSARNYIVEHTDDFEGTAGRFGDSDSCFQDGGCYDNHREAMEDSFCASVFRVYKENGSRLGRAWVYHAHDNAIVLFNGYGIALDKIALLASKLGDQEPRAVTFTSDIYVNTSSCYAIGGEATHYNMSLDIPSEYGYCPICDSELYEDGRYYTEEHGDICRGCFHEDYYECDECSENHHNENNPSRTVYSYASWHSRTHEQVVCPWCADNYYTLCGGGCGEYHRDRDMYGTSYDGLVCRSCYDDKYSKCCQCDTILENDEIELDSEFDDFYCDGCYQDLLTEREREQEKQEELEELAELEREEEKAAYAAV